MRHLLILILALAGCGGDGDGSDTATAGVPGAPAVPVVTLADSVPYANALLSGALRRVVVATGADVDTIADVLTAQQPVVSGDTLVLGFRYDEHRVRDVFHYWPATDRLETRPLPEDAFTFGTPRFAPDGAHLAYVARGAQGMGRGVVRAWPSGVVRYEGGPARLLPGDAGVGEIGWDDNQRFLIAIALAEPMGRWQRARGTVDGGALAQVDVDTAATPR